VILYSWVYISCMGSAAAIIDEQFKLLCPVYR
jgi:hypothetical protein